jgi:hypothetical protein
VDGDLWHETPGHRVPGRRHVVGCDILRGDGRAVERGPGHQSRRYHDSQPRRFPVRDGGAAWYKDNIPFIEVPDAAIQQIYYYRWSTHKRHVRYLDPANGYVISEFMHPPGWSPAFGEIKAAAGHHVYEGRWLRNQRYLDDYERFWMYGGRTPTSGFDTGGINAAHQYSFWAADAYYNRYLVNKDDEFVKALLPELIRQYDEWGRNFDAARGLYWQVARMGRDEVHDRQLPDQRPVPWRRRVPAEQLLPLGRPVVAVLNKPHAHGRSQPAQQLHAELRDRRTTTSLCCATTPSRSTATGNRTSPRPTTRREPVDLRHVQRQRALQPLDLQRPRHHRPDRAAPAQ